MSQMQFEIKPDWMYRKQLDAVFHNNLYGIVEASTKAGKTVSHLHWLIGRALQSPHGDGDFVWWIAPTYDQAQIAFERAPIIYPQTGFITDLNKTELSFRLPNGCRFVCKSADKPHNLYGRDVWALVMDEASRMDNGVDVWKAVQSVTTHTRRLGGGHTRIIGNVVGKQNWAYQKARQAEQGQEDWHYAELTAADAVDAGVLLQDDLDQALRELGEDEFMQLYFNKPVDNEYNPFGNDAIEACSMPEDWLGDQSTAAVVGLDLARKRDYTVAIKLNWQGEVCGFLRTNRDWETQKFEIEKFCDGIPTLVDATGLGDVLMSELEKLGVMVEPYVFTNVSKGELMRRLSVTLREHSIKFPKGQITKELTEFEFKSLPSGSVKYEAPSWGYDDSVMALGLAVHHLLVGGMQPYGPVMQWEVDQVKRSAHNGLRLVS